MRHLIATMLTALVLTALSGCGQMGPLYMPAEQPIGDDAVRPPADDQSTRDAA